MINAVIAAPPPPKGRFRLLKNLRRLAPGHVASRPLMLAVLARSKRFKQFQMPKIRRLTVLPQAPKDGNFRISPRVAILTAN